MKSSFKVLILYPNLYMIHLVPSSIGNLTASLRKAGFELDIFDSTFYQTETESVDDLRKTFMQVRSYDPKDYGIITKTTDIFEDFKRKVNSFQPDLIAASVVQDTLPLALKLIKYLGEKRPLTIFGGIHISLIKEKALKFKEIDIICEGEGEEPLVELCERLHQGKDYTDILNLGFRQGESIKINSIRPLVDLDKLPTPDYSLFDEKRLLSPMQGKMYRMVPIDIERGCPYNCSFCAAPNYRQWYRGEISENYCRKKSVDKIIEETKYLVEKYKLEYLYFNSETFLIYKFTELSRLLTYIKQNIDLPFWCQTRVETVTEERIQLLKDSGCNRITIGLEQGNEEFRNKVVGKQFTNDQFIKATEIIAKVGIPITVNNMIGFPEETRELILDTIEANRQAISDTISAFVFYPFEGTRLYDYCVENNLLEADTEIVSMLGSSIIKNKNISKRHLDNLLKTFGFYVKFPKDRWKEIEEIEYERPGHEIIFKKLAMEYQEKYF